MASDTKTIWTRVQGKSTKEPFLVGRQISKEWLKGGVQLVQVRLSGGMRQVFSDLHSAARNEQKNLPIISLRAGLLAGMDNVVSLDKDLGLIASTNGSHPCAAEIYAPADGNVGAIRENFVSIVKRWIMDEVETWAERNNFGAFIGRLKESITATNIELSPIERRYVDSSGRPDFSLIARAIGERLIGEELFDGLGNCELVLNTEYKSNSVELMTLPKRGNKDEFYSMVARLSIVTLPYSDAVFMSVSAVKRVWAKKVPASFPNMPNRVTGYVISIGRPVVPVSVIRADSGWEFGEDYAALQRDSDDALPKSLSDAISEREFNPSTGWWAGLPELPSIYKFISPRTVFESDEVSLLSSVSAALDPIVLDKPIATREIKLGQSQFKPRQEMLKLADFGVAGAVLVNESSADENDDEEILLSSGPREENLQQYREQNILALKKEHGDVFPIVWMLGGTPDEQELVRKTVQILFGDSLTVNPEPLPDGTHGLRADLDQPSSTARLRFDARIKRWEPATKKIKEVSGSRPIIVLICAPDRINNRPEDSVNYYAGIHAMSLIGANVHHVLPIENHADQASRQSFLHRVQSALLDVLLAHSGIVFGVKEFVGRLIPYDKLPSAIYGVQAVRSRARSRSGESGVCFILYSRIIVETGRTEVRFGYTESKGNKLSDWMPLAKGLQWLGKNRRLQEGNSRWLQSSFTEVTRDMLSVIAQEDSNAIVLVDWSSVAGLWKGIRDEDLVEGKPPRLDAVDLTRFKGMVIARLRRGADTMSLRGSVKTTFEGWREDGGARSATGEVVTDSYFTTNKSLVEIVSDKGSHEKTYGHYIASMGYAKTVQVKRGFSCYRSMPRMCRIGKGVKEFEQKILDPASMDAALPAPMDITIMTCPEGVQSTSIAVLVMGLRLGYAHYNDWTTLPAPLFFRRKIEDYIIRYPEDDDDKPILEREVDSGPPGEVAPSGTVLSEMVTQETEGVVEEAEEESLPDFKEAQAEDSVANLLVLAQQTPTPSIVAESDLKKRLLYQRMVSGDLRVRVDLPYFVKTNGIFGPPPAALRRKTTRIWKLMREFGYVRINKPMPRTDEFMDWLSSHLKCPQACFALVSVTREMGGINFQPLVDIVASEYNPSQLEEDRVSPYSFSPDSLQKLTKWADQVSHDRLLGWLVFMVAQYPTHGWVNAVLPNISKIHGARTEHALEYYLASASAIESAIAQKNNLARFIPVIKELSKKELDASDLEAQQSDLNEEPQSPQNNSNPNQNEQEGDRIMAQKNSIIQLVQTLEPGSEEFESILSKIQENLETLHALHNDEIEKSLNLNAERERLSQFLERQKIIAESLGQLPADLELGNIKIKEVDGTNLEKASEALSFIEDSISDIKALQKQIDQLSEMPESSSLVERKKRNAIEQQSLDSLFARAENLRKILQEESCFAVEALVSQSDFPVEENVPISSNFSAEDIEGNDQVEEGAEQVTCKVNERLESGQGAVEVKTEVESDVEARGALQAESSLLKDIEKGQVAVDESSTESDAKTITENELVPPQTARDLVDTSIVEQDSELKRLDPEIGALSALLDRRLYGFAKIHVEALGKILEAEASESADSYAAILEAIVESLEAIDSQFSFKINFDDKLRELLTTPRFPTSVLCEQAPMALGILAAGLGNMLFDDSDVRWNIGNAVSAQLAGHVSLSSLVEHIDLIRQRGYVLTRDLFIVSHVGDKRAIELELTRFQKRAAEWSTSDEIHSNFNHRGFRTLHEEMFNPKGPIGLILYHISKGDHLKAQATFEEARRKFEKPAATVDELYKKIGERAKPDGLYRVQAIENVEATGRFIESYLRQVNRKNSQSVDLTRDIQTFLDVLHRKLTDAAQEAEQVPVRTKLEMLFRDAAITAIRGALRLYESDDREPLIPTEKQRLLIQLPMNRELMPVLSRIDFATPELCSPQDVLAETSRWSNEALTSSGKKSDDDVDQALSDAMVRHIAAKRFLPAFRVEAILPKSAVQAGLSIQQLYAKEKHSMAADLQEARQKVTHAMTLSALPQEEANRMQRVIEELLSLLRADRSIGHPDGESATYADFPQARAALRFNVIQPLEARLAEARSRLETDLDELLERDLVSLTDVNRIRKILEASDAASLRTAHDALGMLKQTGKLPVKLGGLVDMGAEYDNFMSEVHRSITGHKAPLEALKERLASATAEGEPDWLASLDQEQRVEAINLLNAWTNLFLKRGASDQDCIDALFKALGIAIPPTPFFEHARNNRMRLMFQDRTFMFPTTADDPMFIPPVLGSWATHTQGYVLFGAPQENEIRQLIQEIGNSPTIVLARTKLNMQKRAKVSGNSPVIILDDELVSYIALHPNERFQSLIKVGMLTFSTNPYDDYGLRPVPSEMFFGRQEELNRLRDVKGLAVLYGGRRLGKSSLLSQIEREVRSISGNEAVYISMETVITTEDHILSAWEFIYRALINRKIIKAIGPLPAQWKSIRDWIEKELLESTSIKSLYLLIDEADALMGRELKVRKDEISFVRSLLQLADNVSHVCHLRIVIAGLHNMTRMTTEENSVFGKAQPIALEPFSSADDIQRGIRLITKPLAAMGYLFGSGGEDLPLRILSVCNFYPAFIQLYCRRLVERLQNNRQDVKPPMYIKASDLDAVENDNALLTELRRKFELNLDLDKRYKAIALILADVYYTEIESGHYNGLTTSEIRDYCEIYGGAHFENTGSGVYEALLEEMIKLNVVERIGTRYVLRNPNIAMMIGDRERVKHQIDELAKEPPEAVRNHGERRISMTNRNNHIVFPMPVAWIRRHMDASDGELLILTGNSLSGIMDLSNIEREEWRLQDGVITSVPGVGPQSVLELVTKNRRISADARSPKILSVRNNGWRVEQIPEYAAVANRAGKSGIRIVLLAHPDKALEVAQAIDAGILKHGSEPQRSWRVVPIPPWNEDAIYFRVSENIQVAESGEALSAIRRATSGYGREVLELCGSRLTLQSALISPETRKKVIAPSLKVFYDHIGLPPAFGEESRAASERFLTVVDGAMRNSAEVIEIMNDCGISKGTMDFLYWMGLVQEGPGGTWKVPDMYAELIR